MVVDDLGRWQPFTVYCCGYSDYLKCPLLFLSRIVICMYIGSGCSITGSTYQGLCPTELSLTLYLRISGIAGLLYTCLVGGIWYCKHRGRESEKHKPLFYFIMPLVLIIMYFIGEFVSIYIIGYALRLEVAATTVTVLQWLVV